MSPHITQYHGWNYSNDVPLGGAIGAGLFVGSGSALQSGGPASLVLCFTITGIMVLCTVMSLGEMAVLYPVNGAFFEYAFRFLDPAWYAKVSLCIPLIVY